MISDGSAANVKDKNAKIAIIDSNNRAENTLD